MNSTITFAVGGDHAGFDYKADLIQHLASKGIEAKDFGTYSADSVDYPDFAHPVAEAVEKGEFTFGMLLCGSANGVAITANKHQGVRAGLAWNTEVAKLVRQHNDANVLCLPVRFISLEEAKACIDTFLETPFEGGRHQGRVNKISCC
ncbi:ribose 5-phosphate isomerase B [Sandaracinomonas limnophila]|uniref:Ribose 5-phosphate isomerase B n=1 Tax=Sandaracinomonas limnophila TaxID=1862386 RepID=A0A437PXF7_9BACT|nr:ribose 5-phosphate isomerase B [Sandaracinomonas limnophila]RVU26932.1 ribose 5-phosphate isomerase B [Sandaracinomonas limnophila]